MTSSSSLPPDSSSAPSPSSPPFRPFSSLPIEIIQHVVDCTAPFHYHPRAYFERQFTLRSLCLTSRLFFQLARPRLYAVARLVKREQVKVFRDSEQDRAKVIETFELVLDGQGFMGKFNDLYPLLAVSFSLRSLTLLDFYDGIFLAGLSRLKNLTTLRISDSRLCAIDTFPLHHGTFELPQVGELILELITSDMPIQELISPSTFPALRVLALTDNQCVRQHMNVLLQQLEPQLDLLRLDEDHIQTLDPPVFDKINRKTLFDRLCINDVSLPNVHSLRLWDTPPLSRNGPTLEELEGIVRSTTTPLPSFLYLAGCHSLDPHDPALETARQRFRTVGEERNMEVVYEESPDWDLDAGRPKEFNMRMRGGKVKGRPG